MKALHESGAVQATRDIYTHQDYDTYIVIW